MSIYIKSTHVLYTDQIFVDTLQRSKIWRERETNNLTVKNLDDFGKEMGYDFVTELKPNIYYADGEIINVANNRPITTESQLKNYYTSKIINEVSKFGPANYTVPSQKIKHFNGILLLKQLKNMVETEPRRYKNYMDTANTVRIKNEYKDLSLITSYPQPQLENKDLQPNLQKLTSNELKLFIEKLDRSENHGSKHTHRLTRQTQMLLLAFFGCDSNTIHLFEQNSNHYYSKKQFNLPDNIVLPFKKDNNKLNNQKITELLNFVLSNLKFDKDYHASNVPSEQTTIRKTIKTFLFTIGYDKDWISNSFTNKLDKILSNKTHVKNKQEVKQDMNQRDGRYNFSY